MTEKLFTPSNDIVIDAKLMEKWLGGSKIESLNPKTLFDIQLLLSHYKDIIVPMTNVKVEYPTEGFDTACASVDRGEIFIVRLMRVRLMIPLVWLFTNLTTLRCPRKNLL